MQYARIIIIIFIILFSLGTPRLTSHGTRLAESGVRWQIVSQILYGIRIAKIKIELIISFPTKTS